MFTHLQERLHADTAARMTAAGMASLQHIVGGEGNLWARPTPTLEGGQGTVWSRSPAARPPHLNLEEGEGMVWRRSLGTCLSHPALGKREGEGRVRSRNLSARAPPLILGKGDGVDWSGLSSSSWVLLSARLQGAVALGRGPAVARALTARSVGGTEGWMLPRAIAVQVRRVVAISRASCNLLL